MSASKDAKIGGEAKNKGLFSSGKNPEHPRGAEKTERRGAGWTNVRAEVTRPRTGWSKVLGIVATNEKLVEAA